MKKINVVVMGGGTGTFTVLSGLKKYPDLSLTAVVSSADDGGSNKKFRDEFGLLPPSDFRQCLIALASDHANEETLRKLMAYRFTKGVGLEGQTVGNILIAALTDIEKSQLKAFGALGEILKIKGKILPVTLDNIRLMAEYEDGEVVFGEHLIDEPEDFHDANQKVKRLFLNRKAEVFDDTKQAIKEADYIILGPGDLYTSTIANLIVGDLPQVIKKSKAKVIYITNLMTKYGQTLNFTAMDHLTEISKYLTKVPEYILVNSSKLPTEAIKRYKEEKGDIPVIDDFKDKEDYIVVRKDLLSNQIVEKSSSDLLYRSLIRHDPKKLAEALHQLMI